MPIRIKPTHDLGPCVLNLDSLQRIIKLVDNEFPAATYSATDNVWEIYDEPSRPFLDAVSQRATLDSFVVNGKLATAANYMLPKEVTIVFNESEATVMCNAQPDQQNWFEHFLIDLKKHILPPSFAQRLANIYRKGNFTLSYPVIIGSVLTMSVEQFSNTAKNPYCRIAIRQRLPSPFIESIKANLVSNLIWALFGAILLIIAQWILQTYGINLNPFH